MSLKQLLGEYEVRLDGKGRFRMPSNLLTQLGDWQHGNFVINRGFEQCLVLYPEPLWLKTTAEIHKLNQYNKKNRSFTRYFFRGASEVTLDSADRILLPKRLAEYANIGKDMILSAYAGRIELWSPIEYDKWMEEEPGDFADLADEVLGESEAKTPEE